MRGNRIAAATVALAVLLLSGCSPTHGAPLTGRFDVANGTHTASVSDSWEPFEDVPVPGLDDYGDKATSLGTWATSGDALVTMVLIQTDSSEAVLQAVVFAVIRAQMDEAGDDPAEWTILAEIDQTAGRLPMALSWKSLSGNAPYATVAVGAVDLDGAVLVVRALGPANPSATVGAATTVVNSVRVANP